MKQIMDVRELQVGNIILMVAYDTENCQHNEPEGWVTHLARVVKVDTGRNKRGLTKFDAAAVEVAYLNQWVSGCHEHLTTRRDGSTIDYHNVVWSLCLLQVDGEHREPNDDEDITWPTPVDPRGEVVQHWGTDLS